MQQTTAERTYTPNGLMATLADANGNRTTYTYDHYDRLTRIQYPDPSSAGTSSATDDEKFAYDNAFNVTSFERRSGTSSAAGSVFTNAYDALNRLTSRDGPGSSLDASFAYDNFGRMVSNAQNGQTLSYAYDALSRLVSETGQVSASGHAVSYQYDAASRRTRITWPGALYVAYDFDLTGAMTKVRENGATSGVGVLATYAYDNLGRRASIARGNGASTTYAYDGASRLTGLAHDLASTAHDLTQTFSYDPAGGIASEASSNGAYDWSLGADFSDAYTANGLNQILQAGGFGHSYDLRGNTTAIGAKSFGYDDDNRLVSASGGGLTASALAYDPAGRLKSLAAGATTKFLYDGVQAIAEYDGSNGVLRRYVPGAGTDETLVWYEGSSTADRRWLMADERGSVIAVANSAGAATTVNRYDAYGVPAAGNAGRFQYTGQMYLAELKLHHYKARAYNPETGRFLQPDPIGYAGGMNLYAYAGNDPVNFSDPLGFKKTNWDSDPEVELDEIVVRDVCRPYICNPKPPKPPPFAGVDFGMAAALYFSRFPDGTIGSGAADHATSTNLAEDIAANAICEGIGGCFTVVGHRQLRRIRRNLAITGLAYLAYRGFESFVNESLDPNKLTEEQREALCRNADAAQVAGVTAQGVGLAFATAGAYMAYLGKNSVPSGLGGAGLTVLGAEFALGGFLLEKGGNFVEELYCQ